MALPKTYNPVQFRLEKSKHAAISEYARNNYNTIQKIILMAVDEFIKNRNIELKEVKPIEVPEIQKSGDLCQQNI